MSTAKEIKEQLRGRADTAIAEHSQRFFKTAEGEYGEGDQFLGIRMPVIRSLVKKYQKAPLSAITPLIQSRFHEERLFGVLSLAHRYTKGDSGTRTTVYKAYIRNIKFVNNWDLVDGSAHLIIGPHLENRSRGMLLKYARSRDLWRRRIAIMSTFHYIKLLDFKDTLVIAKILLRDEEDLIHKATGWMLREIGNRDQAAEERFLKQHYAQMPRTMLRYAIERLPEKRRKAYLHGEI